MWGLSGESGHEGGVLGVAMLLFLKAQESLLPLSAKPESGLSPDTRSALTIDFSTPRT